MARLESCRKLNRAQPRQGASWNLDRLTTAAHFREARAAEQRDAADEGRLDACGSIIVGRVIVNVGEVVRPSQLIASVGQTKQERHVRDQSRS